VFKSVVDSGTFSGAALVLAITQPSVSMHIRALEIHLRQPVFERHRGRAPVLTDIGHRIYDHADDMLHQSDRTLADIDALKAVKENVLSFAAHRFIGNHLLSKPLAAFARRNSGIEIIANIGALDQAVEIIRKRDVDLGLFLAHGNVRGVQSEVLGHQRLVFIAAANNPLASCRRLTYRDLAEHPFIGPVKHTEYGRLLRRVFDEVGFTEHNTIIQSQNTLIRRELILSSAGFSCALRSGWAEDLESGELVVLDVVGDPLSLEVRIGSLVDRQISSASNKFVQYLNELKEEGAFDS